MFWLVFWKWKSYERRIMLYFLNTPSLLGNIVVIRLFFEWMWWYLNADKFVVSFQCASIPDRWNLLMQDPYWYSHLHFKRIVHLLKLIKIILKTKPPKFSLFWHFYDAFAIYFNNILIHFNRGCNTGTLLLLIVKNF